MPTWYFLCLNFLHLNWYAIFCSLELRSGARRTAARQSTISPFVPIDALWASSWRSRFKCPVSVVSAMWLAERSATTSSIGIWKRNPHADWRWAIFWILIDIKWLKVILCQTFYLEIWTQKNWIFTQKMFKKTKKKELCKPQNWIFEKKCK